MECGWSWCPQCKRWVPADTMHYDDGCRVCDWCLDGTSVPEKFVYDPYHESVQCVYCDSYDTTGQDNTGHNYKCNKCNEVFYI